MSLDQSGLSSASELSKLLIVTRSHIEMRYIIYMSLDWFGLDNVI